MKLALFTPSAALWPVTRNFDTFIASLDVPGADAERIADSPLYPIADTGARASSRDSQRRLGELHRELYSALLRPSGYFATETRSIAERFWPDLKGTPAGALLGALYFFFLRREVRDVSVVDGLSTLRGVFFNHASSDPNLWLHDAELRLAGLRMDFPTFTLNLPAPPQSRWQDLTFCANLRAGAPSGAGWCWGALCRRDDGLLWATAHCGMDPGAIEAGMEQEAGSKLTAELSAGICRIFGWELAADVNPQAAQAAHA